MLSRLAALNLSVHYTKIYIYIRSKNVAIDHLALQYQLMLSKSPWMVINRHAIKRLRAGQEWRSRRNLADVESRDESMDGHPQA